MTFRSSKAHAPWIPAPLTSFLLLTSFLVVGLMIGGCRARGLPPPADAPPQGELRVLLPVEPRSFEPNKPHDEAATVLASNLFNKLVSFDADGRLFPDLAESWSVGEGGLLYTFHLRRGVHWHDGQPFTSDDVRWTFERLAAEPGLSSEAIRRIREVETPDEATVVIRLEEPWAPFLTTLGWFSGFILPRHHPDLREKPVGTGPFELGEWVRGKRITLVANQSFFRPGPYLDRIVYTFSSDSRHSAEQLLSGAVDYTIVRPPVGMIQRLEREPGIRVVSAPSDARVYCAFNLRRPALADPRVREAINRAIDRQRILDRALHGFGAPALGFYTPAVSWAYNGDAHVPAYDPALARQLLAAAGQSALDLELLAAPISPHADIARLLAEQLTAVGMRIRLVLAPVSQIQERAMARHDFDLVLVSGSQGPDPENLNLRFGSRGAMQFMGYASPELDAALSEGARTVDLTRRARAYFRAQEILARDLPIAPITEGVHLAFFRRGVHGLPQIEARGLVPINDYSLVRVEPAPSS
jgi:peptide/nickel transport system substrate-binding protein